MYVPFISDPAPETELSDELLSRVDVIKPNETEAEFLTGVEVVDQDTARQAAELLLAKSVKDVIVTLGEKDFVLANASGAEYVANRPFKAIDSTPAGDAFTGAPASGMAYGKSIKDATVYANSLLLSV